MNETLKLIAGLKTVHGNFDDREIPDKTIDEIIALSLKTANASARQSYSLIVLSDKEKMRKIFGYKASKAIIACVDFNRIVQTAKFMNHNFEVEEIIPFITGAVDTILLTQTLVITAKAFGIDSLITNGLHRSNIEDVYRILNLPEKYCFPLIAVVFGYSAAASKIKGRLNGNGIIHYETYKELSQQDIENLIQQYDDKQKNIGLIDNWEKLGFDHYLDWFYTKWSQKIPLEKIQEIKNRLISSGFLSR